MNNLPENQIGYQTALFTHFPLPRENVGETFTREYNGQSVTYRCRFGVPHKPADFRMLEIISTLSVKKMDESGRWDGCIDLGRITHILKDYGFAKTAMYSRPMAQAVTRLAMLGVEPIQTGIIKGINFARMKPFYLAKEAVVGWAAGRLSKLDQQPELDGFTHFTASDGFREILQTALPHDQRHVMAIKSQLECVLYYHLAAKAPNLCDKEQFLPWNFYYAQFGKPNMNDSEMKDFRRKVKTYIASIVTKYYTKLKIEIRDQGILIKKSPPLIERSNRHAGFLA
jgi:hypothetical protein